MPEFTLAAPQKNSASDIGMSMFKSGLIGSALESRYLTMLANNPENKAYANIIQSQNKQADQNNSTLTRIDKISLDISKNVFVIADLMVRQVQQARKTFLIKQRERSRALATQEELSSEQVESPEVAGTSLPTRREKQYTSKSRTSGTALTATTGILGSVSLAAIAIKDEINEVMEKAKTSYMTFYDETTNEIKKFVNDSYDNFINWFSSFQQDEQERDEQQQKEFDAQDEQDRVDDEADARETVEIEKDLRDIESALIAEDRESESISKELDDISGISASEIPDAVSSQRDSLSPLPMSTYNSSLEIPALEKQVYQSGTSLPSTFLKPELLSMPSMSALPSESLQRSFSPAPQSPEKFKTNQSKQTTTTFNQYNDNVENSKQEIPTEARQTNSTQAYKPSMFQNNNSTNIFDASVIRPDSSMAPSLPGTSSNAPLTESPQTSLMPQQGLGGILTPQQPSSGLNISSQTMEVIKARDQLRFNVVPTIINNSQSSSLPGTAPPTPMPSPIAERGVLDVGTRFNAGN